MQKLDQKKIDDGFRLLRLDSEEKRKTLSPGISSINSKTLLSHPEHDTPKISRETKSLIEHD